MILQCCNLRLIFHSIYAYFISVVFRHVNNRERKIFWATYGATGSLITMKSFLKIKKIVISPLFTHSPSLHYFFLYLSLFSSFFLFCWLPKCSKYSQKSLHDHDDDDGRHNKNKPNECRMNNCVWRVSKWERKISVTMYK